MDVFGQLCREAGLILHHLVAPVAQPQRQTVASRVEEQRVSPTVILRRTTIEEVEIRKQ